MKKIAGIALVLGLLGGIFVYIIAFKNNTKFNENEVYVYVPSNSDYTDVQRILDTLVKDVSSVDKIAKLRKYDTHVKAGRFLLKKGMGSFQIVTAMRQNLPVKITFNNQERVDLVLQRIDKQIEPTFLELQNVFKDTVFLQKEGLTDDTLLALFIPNTYEFYWNTSAEKLRDKLVAEYHKFWNEQRIQQAKKQNLSPVQAMILASIVHKESVKADERPTIAGVYLNRLAIEMPLQADPTIIFAVKKDSNNFDQVIKRVTGQYLFINSPYNTYKNTGLPPGLIAMPDVSAIEAVLNPDKHAYIYFCANPDKPGYHSFAASYEEHQLNAKKYTEWVNKLGL